MPRRRFEWKLRTRTLILGDRTLIMGVLNVTPDSFSDGGQYDDPDRAYARALELEDDGADIIDIGAESTRPGSQRISEAEELRRLIPVLKRLRGHLRVPISVDTYKAAVAEKALEYDVEIINDPSGLTFDIEIARVVAKANAGLVINHMRGAPEMWAKLPTMKDVMGTIGRDLDAAINRARRAGVEPERIVIDPGVGFGKRKEQNSEILARLGGLTVLGRPILVGVSRKQFLAQKEQQQTEFATAAAVAATILHGAHVVRVHDVKSMAVAVQVADAIAGAEEPEPPKREQRKPPRQERRPGSGEPQSQTDFRTRGSAGPLRPPERPVAEPVKELPPVPRETERSGEPHEDRPYRSGPPRNDRRQRPFSGPPGGPRRAGPPGPPDRGPRRGKSGPPRPPGRGPRRPPSGPRRPS